MASYLGRHVNLALLVVIIGVVVALVGTTVFFQRSLQNRTEAFQTTAGTLDQCQVQLENFKGKYSQAQQEVSETTQDIRKYDQLYEQKVGELKDSQSQLSQTQQQLAFEKLQKEKFQDLYEEKSREATSLEAQIAQKNERISALLNEIDDLEEELEACQ